MPRLLLAFAPMLLVLLVPTVASAARVPEEAAPRDAAYAVEAQTAPVEGTEFPLSFVVGADPSCAVTRISGQLQDANGRPVSGLAVRVTSARDPRRTGLSPLADSNGNWSYTIGNGAVSGLWFVWVDRWGNRVSDTVNVLTHGPENCQPGSKGVQDVRLLFRQAPGFVPAPRSPLPTRPPQPIDPTLRYPLGYVTDVLPNCQSTSISGRVIDGRGAGLNGVRVVLRQMNGPLRREFMTVQNGNWQFFLGTQAIAGQWQVFIEEGGQRESTVIDIQTNGPERCASNSGGIQLVEITFQRRI